MIQRVGNIDITDLSDYNQAAEVAYKLPKADTGLLATFPGLETYNPRLSPRVFHPVMASHGASGLPEA